MSSVAQVIDGVVQQTEKTTTTSKRSTGSTLGKDAFLQLLVAEMRYQDPLEASNNSTEYISQLATFSELEGMQNLQKTAEDMKASSLIGKTVVMSVNDSLVTGQVDFLQYEDGDTQLSVNGELYDLDDLYQVVDGDYLTAYTKAASIISVMAKLPNVESLAESDLKSIGEIAVIYGGMSDYEKSFLTDDTIENLEAYITKYEESLIEPEEVNYSAAILEKLEAYEAKLEELLQSVANGAAKKDEESSDADETEEIAGTE